MDRMALKIKNRRVIRRKMIKKTAKARFGENSNNLIEISRGIFMNSRFSGTNTDVYRELGFAFDRKWREIKPCI